MDFTEDELNALWEAASICIDTVFDDLDEASPREVELAAKLEALCTRFHEHFEGGDDK